jgi:hypothetical protein
VLVIIHIYQEEEEEENIISGYHPKDRNCSQKYKCITTNSVVTEYQHPLPPLTNSCFK